MRILDVDNDRSIKEVIIYLKIEEAKELLDGLKYLIEKNDAQEHVHINDSFFEHEITMVIYNEKNLGMLNKRSKLLIEKDK